MDLGGGHGHLLAHLLQRFPNLRGIVYDMPHLVNGAAEFLASQGLQDRAAAVGGDFFASVPQGADAYIMTAVLHDWNDDACATILRHCRAALMPGGRVLIGDFVLKPVNEPDFGKLIDLEMLIMSESGRERTEEDFRGLFRQAGFGLGRIIPLPAGTSLIEALPN